MSDSVSKSCDSEDDCWFLKWATCMVKFMAGDVGNKPMPRRSQQIEGNPVATEGEGNETSAKKSIDSNLTTDRRSSTEGNKRYSALVADVASLSRRNTGTSFDKKEDDDSRASSSFWRYSGVSNDSNRSGRRVRISAKPDKPLNLWNILKNCIGKDLTKIPFPVNFAEPLSMLQRLTEDYEYASILDQAAGISEPGEQMAHVAAYAVSCYGSSVDRTGKPFNPLLHETFECDRTQDLGWRAISEQVSHHPPIVAQHCEGGEWKCWQEFTMTTKFRGKYLQIIPTGITHLVFTNGSHYTWKKVTTTVYNIIIGKVWVNHEGDMDIINHTNGTTCRLTFATYRYFTSHKANQVNGFVTDKDGNVTWAVNGTWDSTISIAPVLSMDGTSGDTSWELGDQTLVWSRTLPPEENDQYYNLTLLACQLNEQELGVAPTDSRNRPDQRLMEDGLWDEANQVKQLLEERQRTRRAECGPEAGEDSPEEEAPIWFKKAVESTTGVVMHLFTEEYWHCKERQDWTRCPDIFSI